ncbi:MAG TPA: outer membrane beta-barrel domain-containing protein [Bdellovibrionales bacterium]|nr:outer membrane beta-barrel domain-containing protein [Bdellovibrionales bacterium]
MGTSMRFSSLSIAITLLLVSAQAGAQTGQYQRAKKAETKAPPAPAPANGAAQPGAAPAAGTELDKKVDITDLEQKYWVPKDTEFHVVQNRTYTKEKRFAFTLGAGPLINDQYSKAYIYSFTGTYYFNERMGAELTYMAFDTKHNLMTEEFIGRYGVMPEHNKENSYIGAAFNWIPVYAKLALLDKQIIYFDMSFSAGLGVTTYEQQMTGLPSSKAQAPTLALDVAQHYFLGKHWALRLDLRNHIFKWDVKNSRTGDLSRSTTNTSNTFSLGLTYYF